MCDLVKDKYDRPKNSQKVKKAVRDKEQQLAEIIDDKLNAAIARLQQI